ncbi:MAG TPA: class I SAM-dependent methyltransferase [Microthrixaceae bacterium]|nr:class I SAM-dependent methyltransferase [Microthrixaceae bacterium]
MKLTGERPIEGETPDSLLALHAAGYREVRSRIGPGRFLDLGCGLGDGTATFASPDRSLVGIDYDPATAAAAYRARRDVGLVTACGDGSALGLRDDSFDHVCSSHLIEHFVDPSFHVSEVARVLRPGGSAYFLTPNAPADFENPYHVYLFEPDDLREMLSQHFAEVTIIGLDATAAVKADFEKRRKMAQRLLRLDVFDLRHKLPRSWFVQLHAVGRRVAYRFLVKDQVAGNSGITDEEFFLTDEIDSSTLVLFAIAEKPLS